MPSINFSGDKDLLVMAPEISEHFNIGERAMPA